jgi:hypothetical protein
MGLASVGSAARRWWSGEPASEPRPAVRVAALPAWLGSPERAAAEDEAEEGAAEEREPLLVLPAVAAAPPPDSTGALKQRKSTSPALRPSPAAWTGEAHAEDERHDHRE